MNDTNTIPSVETLAIPLITPIREGAADVLPGLLPRAGGTVISGETNVGKAQPLDARVLTPTGWKNMGDLRVGDALESPDGLSSQVLAIHPRGERQAYRVTFSDGRSTETCGEHLWRVYHPNWSRHKEVRLVKTEDILSLSEPVRHRACIDTPTQLQFETSAELPLHPWLLGVLLGDGSLTANAVSFTSADNELVDRVQSIVEQDLMTVKKHIGPYDFSIVRAAGSQVRGVSSPVPNPYTGILTSLGVMGCHSYEKVIPNLYMNANRENREQLLQGLLDTDGYVSPDGRELSFTSTSLKLAEQVTELVWSLGGVCGMRPKSPFYRDKNGNKVMCRTAYTVNIYYHSQRRMISLTRKLSRLKDMRRMRRLKFESVVPSRVTETQCITVSHPQGLYVTDNYIVTHNSLVGLEIASALIANRPLWGGIKPTVHAKRILYVLAEHHNETIQRLWQRTRLPMTDQVLLLGPESLGADKWLVSNGKPNLDVIDKFKRWAEGSDLLVWDPLAAFVCGADGLENDSVTMRLLIDSINLIAASAGATSLILAHQGKPMIDQWGKEHTKTKYALRGSSATEDAATSIFYMSKVAGEPNRYELLCRKFKGDAPGSYQLLRSTETLTHSMMDNNNYIESRRIDAKAKIARMMEQNPNFSYRSAARILSAVENVPTETMFRWLGVKAEEPSL